MRRPDGTLALVAVLLILLLWHASRGFLPFREEPPAFSVSRPGTVIVRLGQGFPNPGVYRFFDGVSVSGVIQLAGGKVGDNESTALPSRLPLRSGESLDISTDHGKVIEVRRKFLPAAQRITLEIALQPDTLTVEGWQALPGIGPHLAARIVQDRQKNGDFGDIGGLCRVKGIGKRTVERLRVFFEK